MNKPEQSVAHLGYEWSYRVVACTDDGGDDAALEVQHPGNGRWELAEYVLADATDEELAELVKEYAEKELQP